MPDCIRPVKLRLFPCAAILSLLTLWLLAPAQLSAQEITFLEGHQQAIYAVVYSPDGKTLATASADGTVKVWDIESGELIRTINDFGKMVLALATSPDGLQLSTAGLDGQLRQYDLPMRAPLATGTGLPNTTTDLAVSADGKLVLTGDISRTVRLWNAETATSQRDLAGSTGAITAVGLTPDGGQAVASADDGSLRGWTSANGAALGVFYTPPAGSLSVHPQGTHVATGGADGLLRVHTWPPAQPLSVGAHGGAVAAVELTPDGKSFVSGSVDQTVRIYRVKDGQAQLTLSGQSGQVTDLALGGADENPLIAASSATGITRVWKLAKGEVLGGLEGHVNAANGVAIRPDGQQIATVGQDGTLRLWRVPTPARSLEGHTSGLTQVVLSHDGKVAATTAGDKTVRLWSLENGKSILQVQEHPSGVSTVALSPDEKLIATGDPAGVIRIVERKSGKPVGQVTAHAGAVARVAFNQDSQRLYSCGADGTLKAWKLPLGEEATLAEFKNGSPQVIFSADEKSLLVGNAEEIKSIDAQSGKVAATFEGQTGNITSLVSDPKSQLVATTNNLGVVHVWKPDGTPLGELRGHAGHIYRGSVSADAKLIATSGADGSVRLWDAPTTTTPLAGHEQPVTATAYSADGKQAATGDASGSVRLWNPADGKPAGNVKIGEQAVNALTYSPDAKQLYVGTAEGGLVVIDAATGEVAAVRQAHDGALTAIGVHSNNQALMTVGADGRLRYWKLPLIAPTSHAEKSPLVKMAVSSSGKLSATATEDKMVQLTDPAKLMVTRSVGPLPAEPISLAVSGNDALVAAGDSQGGVHVWNSADGKPLGSIFGHAGPVRAVAIHPAATHLATAGDDGTIRYWSVPQPPRTFEGPTGAVTAAAVSPNGQLLAVVDGGNEVKILKLADGKVAQTLKGHTAPVTAVAWRHDSAQIATASRDKSARLWNPSDGKQAQMIEGHKAELLAVAFSPDGKQLATGGTDRLAKLWNTADMTEVAPLEGHTGAVTSIVYSPKLNEVVTASADGTLHLWKQADGTAVRTINHGAAVSQVAINGDGTKLVSAGADKQAKLWNAATGAALGKITGHTAKLTGVAFTGETETELVFTSSADGTAQTWNVAGLPLERFKWTDAQPTAVAISPDGKQLLIGSSNRQLQVYPRSLVRELKGHAAAIGALAFVGPGEQLLSGAADNTLRLWNLADGAQVRSMSHSGAVNGVAVSADGKQIASASADKTARLWNLADGKQLHSLAHPAAVAQVGFSPDGKRVVSQQEDGVAQVWETETAIAIERFFPEGPAPTGVSFLGDGSTLLIGGKSAVSQSTVAVTSIIAAHEGAIHDLVVLNGGANVATGGVDKIVRLWDAAGAKVREFSGNTSTVNSLSARADNTLLAAGSANNHVYIWKVSDAAQQADVTTPSAALDVAFGADPNQIVVGGADHHVRLYDHTTSLMWEDVLHQDVTSPLAFDPVSRKLLISGGEGGPLLTRLSVQRVLTGHEGAVYDVAISPDGQFILSGGQDKTVRLWQAADGKPVHSYSGNTAEALCVGFSPDGGQVLSGGADRSLRIWTRANAAAVKSIETPGVVRTLRAAPDGTRVVLGGDDTNVGLWDVASGKMLEQFTGHTGSIRNLAITQDGQTIVSAAADGAVRRWSLSAQWVAVADAAKANDLAVSDDGELIATAGDDKVVKLWDPEGKLVRQYGGSATPLRKVAISPDGTRLAAGGDPVLTAKNLYVWNRESGTLERNLALPAAVTSVAFSSDSQRVAASCGDQKIYVYSTDEGRLLEAIPAGASVTDIAFAKDDATVLATGTDNKLHQLSVLLESLLIGHEGAIDSVAYLPDGKQAVTGGADKTLRVWNLDDQTEAQKIDAGATVLDLEVTTDGKLLAAAGDDRKVQLWTLADGKPAGQLDTPHVPRGIRFSPNGTRLAVACDDAQVHLYDVASAAELERFVGHATSALSVGFSTDGATMISGGGDNTVRLWTPSVQSAAQAHQGPITGVAYSADGEQLFTAGGDQKLRQFSSADLKPQQDYIGADGPLQDVAVSSDGKRLVAGGDDGHLLVWPVGEDQLLAKEKLPSPIASVAIGPDGQKILAAGVDMILRNYVLPIAGDAPKLTLVQTGQSHTAQITAIGLSGDGRQAFTTSEDRTMRRWFAASAAPRRTIAAHSRAIYDLEYNRDGSLLATASADGTARLWNQEQDDPLATFEGHQAAVQGVDFRTSGEAQLATCGRDGKILIWDLQGNQKKEISQGLSGALYRVEHSPNGRYLATGGDSRLMYIWDQAPEKLLVEPSVGHAATIYDVTYNPAGSRIATLDYDGKLFIWNSANGAILHHQQLPAPAGYALDYSPDGKQLAIGTRDKRLMLLAVPTWSQ